MASFTRILGNHLGIIMLLQTDWSKPNVSVHWTRLEESSTIFGFKKRHQFSSKIQVQKLLNREAFSLVCEHLKKRNSWTTQKDVVEAAAPRTSPWWSHFRFKVRAGCTNARELSESFTFTLKLWFSRRAAQKRYNKEKGRVEPKTWPLITRMREEMRRRSVSEAAVRCRW